MTLAVGAPPSVALRARTAPGPDATAAGERRTVTLRRGGLPSRGPRRTGVAVVLVLPLLVELRATVPTGALHRGPPHGLLSGWRGKTGSENGSPNPLCYHKSALLSAYLTAANVSNVAAGS